MTNAQLLAEAAVIKNETNSGANTAERVGTMLEDIINNTGGNYKVYTALLTQSGQDAPTADVLFNNTGIEFSWGYDGQGYYYINQTFLNQQNSFISIQNNTGINGQYYNITTAFSGDYLVVWTDGTDGVLDHTFFELRIYE